MSCIVCGKDYCWLSPQCRKELDKMYAEIVELRALEMNHEGTCVRLKAELGIEKLNRNEEVKALMEIRTEEIDRLEHRALVAEQEVALLKVMVEDLKAETERLKRLLEITQENARMLIAPVVNRSCMTCKYTFYKTYAEPCRSCFSISGLPRWEKSNENLSID